MLLLGFQNLGQQDIQKKYPDKFNILEMHSNNLDKNEIINFIQNIKIAISQFDVVYVKFTLEIVTCLTALNIPFKVVYNETEPNDLFNVIENKGYKKIKVSTQYTLENLLLDIFNWKIDIDKPQVLESEKQDIVLEPIKSKTKLSLGELIKDDIEVTESDVREFKSITNKLKMGMLVQAKSNLKRVLKLSDILDKLYDKLLDRVENSLDTCDTASLMYTTEYISKALSDTNNFIMALINNDKIQNFFIIDNSSVVNINSDNRLDLDKRERIRKAAEIVMNNLDYFVEEDYNKIVNPNVIEPEYTEVIKEDSNAESKS